jgi:hypothetical protein
MSRPPSERKKLQRQRDRALGWVEVTVKVAAERADEIRMFAASLPGPKAPTDPRQLCLIDVIEKKLSDLEAARDGSQKRMDF